MDEIILESEALRLPARERALLADALLGSLEDEAARGIQDKWAAEADDRLEAFRRGELQAMDGPTVLREMRARYER